jgi:glycosyltransferase involved in cell wall biosynthesis
MPGVSIIIAVHNGEPFLAEAIACALAQSRPAEEIIVVDDGSTDGTAALLERHRPRLQVLRQERGGLAAARARAMAQAHGEYLAFWDHDDLWHPRFLEACLARLSGADAAVVGVVANFARVDRAGAEVPGTCSRLGGRIGLRELLPINLFPPGPVVLRRDAVRGVGGFEPALRLVVDWDLWLRLTLTGGSFAAVEDCLFGYRLHADNLSRHRELMLLEELWIIDRLFARPELPPDLAAAGAAIVARLYLNAAIDCFAAGDGDAGGRSWRAALHALPALIDDDDAYWAVACADADREAEGYPFNVELAQGEQRLMRALTPAADERQLDPAQCRRARARAYRVLAQLAYGRRDMRAVRRCTAAALAADPTWWRAPRTLAPLIKSLIGPRLIDRLSRRRLWRRLPLPRGRGSG